MTIVRLKTTELINQVRLSRIKQMTNVRLVSPELVRPNLIDKLKIVLYITAELGRTKFPKLNWFAIAVCMLFCVIGLKCRWNARSFYHWNANINLLLALQHKSMWSKAKQTACCAFRLHILYLYIIWDSSDKRGYMIGTVIAADFNVYLQGRVK